MYQANRYRIDMKNLYIPIAISILFYGCASVTGTPIQSVSVQTKKGDQQVVGVSCELQNSKGKWFVTTPGSVSIGRSSDDLRITCKKEGMDQGVLNVVSDAKTAMYGNFPFGGIVGAVVDHNTGAGYEYPTLITVLMGDVSIIKSPSQTAQTNNESASK